MSRIFNCLINNLYLKNNRKLKIVELNKVVIYRITHIENIPHILQYGITRKDSQHKILIIKILGT